MNHGNSGLAHGTSGSPQITIENQEMAEKAKENEANIRKQEADFYGGEKGKLLLPAKYKKWIGVSRRQEMLKKAKNPKLHNAVNQIYRPGAVIGDGGTASVIKFEKRTGIGLGKNGGTHEKKGREMIKYIEDKIPTQSLSKSDRKLANYLVKKLKQALGGKYNDEL